MLATSLVLCAAVLHATWNTLVKFSSDRLLVVACMDVVGVLCAILLLPFVSLPPAEVWPWLLGATVLQLLYRVLLIEAYKVGDLGLVYPLMRGLSPLVVLGLTLAFGGEQLSGRQILGILLIPFGMLCLGVCVLASYGLVLWAMQLGSIAEAAALRETSVLLAVLFGMRFLNEPFGLPRLLACGLVLAGMLLMKL